MLRPGDSITYLQLPRADGIAEAWKKLDQARFGRLTMRVCYCSTLDDCFEARSDRDDPQAVDRCRATPREEQWRG